MFTLMSLLATPSNRLVANEPRPRGIQLYSMRHEDFLRVKFYDYFSTIMFYLIWPNFLSVGIVKICFQSAKTDKYTTPPGHSSFQFAPLTLTYKLFPRWNQRRFDFISLEPNNTPQHASEKFSWATSGKRAAMQPLCGYFERVGTWTQQNSCDLHAGKFCAQSHEIETFFAAQSQARLLQQASVIQGKTSIK